MYKHKFKYFINAVHDCMWLFERRRSIQSATDDKRRCILIKFTDFNIDKICQINKKALFLHSI